MTEEERGATLSLRAQNYLQIAELWKDKACVFKNVSHT